MATTTMIYDGLSVDASVVLDAIDKNRLVT